MAREENSRICLNMQLIAILSRIGVDTDENSTNAIHHTRMLKMTTIHGFMPHGS